jgi:hypothetical protein
MQNPAAPGWSIYLEWWASHSFHIVNNLQFLHKYLRKTSRVWVPKTWLGWKSSKPQTIFWKGIKTLKLKKASKNSGLGGSSGRFPEGIRIECRTDTAATSERQQLLHQTTIPNFRESCPESATVVWSSQCRLYVAISFLQWASSSHFKCFFAQALVTDHSTLRLFSLKLLSM